MHYLKKTQDKSMYVHPDGSFKLSYYVDADFGGLFGSEAPGSPVEGKFRT